MHHTLLTVHKVNGIRLEERIRQLEHGPHVGRDGRKLERQIVHQLVHVVEQIYGGLCWNENKAVVHRRVLTDELVLEREMNDWDNHFLHLSQDFFIRVY